VDDDRAGKPSAGETKPHSRAAKTTATAKTPRAKAPDTPPPAEPATAPTSDAPLALYRRYRPDTFAEVIGQEHVTEPLMRALTNNKVNHAYLFSGPRGCGKTTSARILARCLNCAQGPTPTPCGTCQSCRDLATGGPGSIDVIELDAATHGLVDDARDLRERAQFAPVQSRFKVYIIDEAHMVTPAGFNALLKLVEEPPPHVRFIFATTEPEKVIGTIRSRTHHYPFRLVPPKVLSGYLGTICAEEGVHVADGVLSLVVRAGAGSVRDALSVLDQLLGAAGPDGVSYEAAAALLGYTPDALLDEIVDAFVAGDGRRVFTAVGHVIDAGGDPRRFAADLLERLRDLIIIDQVPDATGSGLIDVSADQAERLRAQASALGSARLTGAAEVMAAGLTGMRGTTAPRLHLELMCARVLLGATAAPDASLAGRLDRLERRLAATPPAERAPRTPPGDDEPGRSRAGFRPAETPAVAAPPPQQRPAPARPPWQRPAGPSVPDTTPPVATGPLPSLAQLRALWPQVLDEIKHRRRATWFIVNQNVAVADVADGAVIVALATPGLRESFTQGHDTVLTEALRAVLHTDVTVRAIVGASDTARVAAPEGPPSPGPAPSASRPPGEAGAARPAAAEPDDMPDPVADTNLDDVGIDDADEVAADLLVDILGAQPIDDPDDD